ncbi:MAG: Ppx/GppA family phosphatase [Actinobacteria bacterium]|nr:Ppx/GppA family phosphatase [Actinomycetota bacterium]
MGSNSTRLLVVDRGGEAITRELTITRLAEGVDRTGHLADEALQRTLETLARYRTIWEAHGARHVRIAATSAVRDAADRDRFFAGVREVAGVDARVLSGDEEAATAYAGAVVALELPRPCAVLDIGGGSTELIVGDERDAVVGSVSLQLGCVRLTERLLPDDPPTVEQLEAARAEVESQLQRADDALADTGSTVTDATVLVGVAGTVTTIAALHLGLDRYDPERIHGTEVPRTAVTAWVARLAEVPAAGRATFGPMQAGREDVIVGGALILAGVLDRYGFDAIVASEADILDGLARGLGAATW